MSEEKREGATQGPRMTKAKAPAAQVEAAPARATMTAAQAAPPPGGPGENPGSITFATGRTDAEAGANMNAQLAQAEDGANDALPAMAKATPGKNGAEATYDAAAKREAAFLAGRAMDPLTGMPADGVDPAERRHIEILAAILVGTAPSGLSPDRLASKVAPKIAQAVEAARLYMER